MVIGMPRAAMRALSVFVSVKTRVSELLVLLERVLGPGCMVVCAQVVAARVEAASDRDSLFRTTTISSSPAKGTMLAR